MIGFARHKRRSIREKLTRSFVLLSGVSVLLVCICFLAYDTISNRKALSQQLSSVAEVIRYNSAATLVFADAEGAEAILGGLKAQKEIRVACLFTSSGALLAKYPAETAEECEPPGPDMAEASYEQDELRLFQRVENDGEVVGSLVIHRRLDDLRQHVFDRLYISGAIFMFAMLASLIMAAPLQRFLTDPILHLASVARRVTSLDQYSLRATQHSDDELGDLTVALNEMLQRIEARDQQLEEYRSDLEQKIRDRTIELRGSNETLLSINQRLEDEIEERENAQKEREALHRELVKASRQAGMAEVATGVLHNVGNVLNSVNVGIQLLREQAHSSKVARLGQAMAIANEHANDPARFIAEDPRGQKLFVYLTRLGESLVAEQEQVIREIDSIREFISHINQIVAAQQDYAGSAGITELLDPSELIEEALRSQRDDFERFGVKIVRDYQAQPAMRLDRHRVLQIAVNIVRNALQAFESVEQEEKQLTIRIASNSETLSIEFEDNGPGIATEDLTKIFGYGFTTKAKGHGFGLHSCATRAMEMRGSLTARSDGPGCGAVFVLELPTHLALREDDRPSHTATESSSGLR